MRDARMAGREKSSGGDFLGGSLEDVLCLLGELVEPGVCDDCWGISARSGRLFFSLTCHLIGLRGEVVMFGKVAVNEGEGVEKGGRRGMFVKVAV